MRNVQCYLCHNFALFLRIFYSADEEQFRNLVVWLEDKIIRFYKIGDRFLLRETSSNEWNTAFNKASAHFIFGCSLFVLFIDGHILAWFISL